MNLALSIRQRPIADYSFTRLSRPEESSGLSQPRNGDFNLNIAFECHRELDESKSVDPRRISRGINASLIRNSNDLETRDALFNPFSLNYSSRPTARLRQSTPLVALYRRGADKSRDMGQRHRLGLSPRNSLGCISLRFA